jgi:hypothetical protein
VRPKHVGLRTNVIQYIIITLNISDMINKSYSVTGRIHYIKISNAIQVKDVHQYNNTKRKLLRINAGIWFNKKCLKRAKLTREV